MELFASNNADIESNAFSALTNIINPKGSSTMYRTIPTRSEIREAKESASKSAFKKPVKSKCLVGLAAGTVSLGLLLGSPLAAMAATDGGTLGPAVTLAQAQQAMASASSETLTGVSETTDGLNLDASVSNLNTSLSVSTLSDNGAGTYDIQAAASGTTAGNWTDTVGQTFSTTYKGSPATVTVTSVNGTSIDLTVSIATPPAITPVFTITASSTGPAPVAQKGTPTAVDVSEVLDTSKAAPAPWDVISQQTPSTGYQWDASSLMFIDPISGTATPVQKTNGADLTVVNGLVDPTNIKNWSGFANLDMTLTEKWAGPGAEPAGWSPSTITFKLKVQYVGTAVAQPSPSDCTVQAPAAGGTGFSVHMAVAGSTGTACDFQAVADTSTLTADKTQATVDLGGNDITSNSSYKVDPASIELQAPDGTFAKHVIYPGEVEVSVDPVSGIATEKRQGPSAAEPKILYRASEYKLDSNGNKVLGGSSSALLTVTIEAVPTTPTPVVPETPVVPAPVVPETPVTATVDIPAPVISDGFTRPFQNLGDTRASLAGPSAPLTTTAVVTPKQNDSESGLAELGALIALGTAGAFAVRARHRKVQQSDVNA